MAARNLNIEITQRFIDAIEAGLEGKWERPWTTIADAGMPLSLSTGKNYRGINVWILMMEAWAKGYQNNLWGTYKQWQEKGAQVRKGEKSTMVVLWKPVTKQNDQGEDNTFMMLRGFNVFNVDQVEGYEMPENDDALPESTNERIAAIENLVSDIGVDVRHGGNRAFYVPSMDFVQMPLIEQFKDSEGYYSTLLHEMVHWTGHASRVDRDLNAGRFGDEAYAFEELVAELGSAFLMAQFGISDEPREDHAKYLRGWLKVLQNDSKAIFTAASKAQAAVDFINGHEAATSTTSDDDEGEAVGQAS